MHSGPFGVLATQISSDAQDLFPQGAPEDAPPPPPRPGGPRAPAPPRAPPPPPPTAAPPLPLLSEPHPAASTSIKMSALRIVSSIPRLRYSGASRENSAL